MILTRLVCVFQNSTVFAIVNQVVNIGASAVPLRLQAAYDDQTVSRWAGELQYARGLWFGAVGAERSSITGHYATRARIQINTGWMWLSARSEMSGSEVRHWQSARGTVSLGNGIALSSLHEENTEAVIRIFADTNLNGAMDPGEAVSYDALISVPERAPNRASSGVWRLLNLEPHATYTVTITRESIIDPNLHPATGYVFAFVAEPGRTRRIDIPLQPLPVLTGQVSGWPAAYELLKLSASSEVHRLPIYSDGAFLAQLPPAEYEVLLKHRITGAKVRETTFALSQTQTRL